MPHGHRLIDADLDAQVIRDTTRRYMLAPVGCFLSVQAGLLIASAVTLYYLIPFQVFRFN